MRRSVGICFTLAALVAAAAAPAQTAEARPAINPEAMSALARMGAYLRDLKAFQIRAVTVDEEVLDNGLKIQYESAADLLASRPDRLRIDVANDRHQRLFLFDGKDLTLYGQRLNYYATVPAPGTIAELAEKLESEHGFALPLVDLFRWGAPGWEPGGITAALDVGTASVDGTTCQHFAFRQPGIDWQIWIQKGDHPLPRRLVITTTIDEARPQHTATYTWNLAPSFNDAAFVFVPPAGAQRIALAKAP